MFNRVNQLRRQRKASPSRGSLKHKKRKAKVRPVASPREEILAAANKTRSSMGLPPLSKRHTNQAVAIVRHKNLVGPDVLEAAGFNSDGPRFRKGR